MKELDIKQNLILFGKECSMSGYFSDVEPAQAQHREESERIKDAIIRQVELLKAENKRLKKDRENTYEVVTQIRDQARIISLYIRNSVCEFTPLTPKDKYVLELSDRIIVFTQIPTPVAHNKSKDDDNGK